MKLGVVSMRTVDNVCRSARKISTLQASSSSVFRPALFGRSEPSG